MKSRFLGRRRAGAAAGSRSGAWIFWGAAVALGAALVAVIASTPAQQVKASSPSPDAGVVLKQLSSDTFTNTTSQHDTEVEPDTFSFGSTIVTAFQVGRFSDGGSSDIGFATSTDGGKTWTSGYLPGITNIQGAGNPYDRDSDPAVAYDAAHGEWLISSLPLVDSGKEIPAVIVSRSSDGLNWDNPVSVTGNVVSSDKDWIVCDNSPSSPFYGNCYVEWDNPAAGDKIQMATSSDGGLTWGAATSTGNNATGLGGQPVVQPNGTVVVPIEGTSGSQLAFSSTDGGNTWTSTVKISTISDHGEAGGLRSGPLPSAAVDAAGTVYVVWQDCRFRTGCKENDIVLSTSTDGSTWSSPSRIPIDATTSTIDHFIPGIGVDPATSGSTAHLGVTYYFYQNTSCTSSTCRLGVGFISSKDGGATWSPARGLTASMQLGWLPNTTLGTMVGDYISTSFVNGRAFGVFAVAKAKSGTTFNEAMFTTNQGLTIPETGPTFSSAGDKPVPNAKSDHKPWTDQEERGKKTPPPSKTGKRARK